MRSGLQDSRVEDYLDHVLAPMVGEVAYETRQELRRDMRAHIMQLIAAHEELGSEPAEAVTAALRQFGRPSIVAGKWLEELQEAGPDETLLPPARAAISKAFKASAAKLAMGVSLWTLGAVFFERYLNGELATSLYLTLGAAIPLTVGFTTGRKFASGRPILGMLLAQAATLPFWPFLMMVLMNLFRHMEPDYRVALMLASISFTALAPVGCLGAWFGARHRRKRRRRAAIN